MIPFFRKIRYRLAKNNQFFKYSRYAIGEIVLVVVGILIALYINNWNEERKKRTKEQYYLKSIMTSIDLSQEELNRVTNDAKSIYTSADTLFLLLAHGKFDQLNGFTLDTLLNNSRDYSLISLNDGGIKEILNTGTLSVIQDEKIRIILASWDERFHKIRKFESETEYISKSYNEYLMDYFDVSRYETGHRSGIIPEKKQHLLTDPKLRNFLDNIFYIHKEMHEKYNEEKEMLDSLSVLVNQHILK
jgi:hypothetical protein